MRDAPDDLPEWAAAVAQRLAFFARGQPRRRAAMRALARTLAALRRRCVEPGGAERVLAEFLEACLVLVTAAVAVRPDLAGLRLGLAGLCALARAELVGGKDDRPLLAAEAPLRDLPGAAGAAAGVPGRAVFLAAVAGLPEEAGPAAVMLVNDLAATGWDLPGAALEVAAGLRRLAPAG